MGPITLCGGGLCPSAPTCTVLTSLLELTSVKAPMPRMTVIAPFLSGFLILASCGDSAHQVRQTTAHINIPPELEKQIDASVSFVNLHAPPANFVGRIVKVGGIVLRGKRTKIQTEFEVLQLPMETKGPPTTERPNSEGRCLAIQGELLDPSRVPTGTPITVISVVKGETTRPLDESEFSYPVLGIKYLIDWNAVINKSPVETEWVAVEKNYLFPERQTVYIDPNTIRREKHLVTLWQLIDYKWMQGKGAMINPHAFGRLYRYMTAPHGFFSTKTRKQFDCMNNRVRLLESTDFSHRMGTGRRNKGYVDQDNWLPIEPESVNQSLWEVACGKS